MKFIRYFISLLLVFSLSGQAQAPSIQKAVLLMEALSQTLEKGHYLELDFDDAFSGKVYEDYLEALDYNKKYFLQADIEQLAMYKTAIDDEIRHRSYNFFNFSLELFKARLEQSRGFYEEILSQPFDFTRDEMYSTDEDNMDYASDDQALKERWRKQLKYQTLVRLVDKIRIIEKRTGEGYAFDFSTSGQYSKEDEALPLEEKSYGQIEAEVRNSLLKSQQNLYDRIMELDKEDHRARYLNAITGVYDPHTSFYPPKDKENFDISMSGSFEGIGATLQKKDGYIKVVRIVVGSACWRQGDLEVGDKIMKVAQASDEPVNVMDMPLDDAVQLIRGPKGSEVRLTVKKRDGSIKVIPIIRDVVELRETFAQSAILQTEEGNKTGYIKLPKFYVDMNHNNGRSCYQDVHKQVGLLKERDIEGIIIDLRNNGGGSLGDAVKIAGLFINKGPVVQIKARGQSPEVLRDRNLGTDYDGPLVVMVNSFSASASEIFAAAIQDYGRGVVVGSSSTYGKGTVQRFVNFDQMLPPQLQAYKPLGSLKLTIQKFYRVNGGATQLRGVTPDIVLPDVYNLLDVGERERENAMAWDKIAAAGYKPWEGGFPLKRLQNKSQKRIGKNERFQAILDEAQRMKSRSDEAEHTLHLETFKTKQDKLKEEARAFEKLRKQDTGLDVVLNQSENEEIARDSSEVERQERFRKKLQRDIHLFEAVSIAEDML